MGALSSDAVNTTGSPLLRGTRLMNFDDGAASYPAA